MDSQEVSPIRPKRPLPRALRTLYQPNHGTFLRWSQDHRSHQIEALQGILGHDTGQVCLPTGTGKTRVQIAIHVKEMIDMMERGKYGVFVTAAHRLALCTQLLEELIEVAVHAGLPFDILFVGSTRFPEDKVHAKFREQGLNSYINEATSTTQGDEIRAAMLRSRSHKRHLLCVSTYHSFHKLESLDSIDVATYDEAHTVVNDGFMENLETVRPKVRRNYFFTATRRVQGLLGGMNDESFFGQLLCEKSPRLLIEAGEIVAPRIHIINTVDENGDYDNHTMRIRTVIQGFVEHRAIVKKHSYSPDFIGAKLLVTTTGNLALLELIEDAGFKDYCRKNNIKTFAFSSEYGAFFNFATTSRVEAMSLMRSLADEEDAILMHIDILTEGIDLPSITGVMPFRELSPLKLVQTIGRASRLMKEDRKRVYSGLILPAVWDRYIKPYCWVLLPKHFRSLGDTEAMKNALRCIYNFYEVPVEEYVPNDEYITPPDEDALRITEHDKSDKKDKESDLIHTIEEIMIEEIRELIVAEGITPAEALRRFFAA